jgi:hypothetical protein
MSLFIKNNCKYNMGKVFIIAHMILSDINIYNTINVDD